MARISRRTLSSSSSATAAATTVTSSSSYSSHQSKSSRADYLPRYIIDGANGFRGVNGGGSPLRLAASIYPDPLRGYKADDEFAVHPSYPDYESNVFGSPSSVPAHLNTARPSPAAPDSSSSPPFLPNKTSQAQILLNERERIRAEFFATYDVMTGVRIAATLSGFFGLMVFLIVWKSRSSSNETLKVLKDPKMAAVAAVCMQEEEERKIQEAMVATGMSIYPDEYDAILYRRQRMLSLGNVSAPPVLHRGYRFSSVGGGGYSSLLEPPRRFSYSYGGQSASSLLVSGNSGGGGIGGRRKSRSESLRILSNYPMGSSFGTDDYFIETDDELENADYHDNGKRLLDSADDHHHKRTDSTKSNAPAFLAVPHVGYDSRRSSAMTCCSTESSYLERRSSAFTLGLANLPPSLQRKLSTSSRTSSPDNWDYYYPDIQVIQPTPKASPCPSERNSGTSDHLPTGGPAEMANRTTATTTSTTNSNTTTIKTASKPTTAANGTATGSRQPLPTFVRKHSIAFYDPGSAQAGRKQQIHSISADTVDLFPYNHAATAMTNAGMLQNATAAGFLCSESPTDELRLSVRRKIAAVEVQRSAHQTEPVSSIVESKNNNNNDFAYNSSSTAAAVATTPAPVANSSSLSMDSTPISVDRLNGSGSLGTTAKTFFNPGKRAPLASLSSFKISSLEYQDSDLRSLDEDSVYIDSVADTDEDIQQFSSESEEASMGDLEDDAALGTAETPAVEAPTLSTNESTTQYTVADKRYSLGAFNISAPPANNRPRRPLLQRHSTISASSSDRISLLDQQLKEFSVGQFTAADSALGTQSPIMLVQPTQALETHFGTLITTSPPTHLKRAQFLQQHSDPQSLPTTTANTEDDTCSTLNTEVCAATMGGSGSVTPQAHLRGGGSSRCSSQSNVSGNVSSHQVSRKQQLPRSRLADDSCASHCSISDSVIAANTTGRPIICVPSSLKNLIIRGSMQTDKFASSPTGGPNLSRLEGAENFDYGVEGSAACPSVMLELPLIKLPADESSESSSASEEGVGSRSISDESRDPSLPGSSRKWSKETLF